MVKLLVVVLAIIQLTGATTVKPFVIGIAVHSKADQQWNVSQQIQTNWMFVRKIILSTLYCWDEMDLQYSIIPLSSGRQQNQTQTQILKVMRILYCFKLPNPV